MTEISRTLDSTLSQKQSNSRRGQSIANLQKNQSDPSQSTIDVQPELDALWHKWSKGANIDKYNINRMLNVFNAEIRRKFKEFVPTELASSNLRQQIELTKHIQRYKDRPFDGPLGEWFEEQLRTNALPDALVNKWFARFNYVREYKEFVYVCEREPVIKPLADTNGRVGSIDGSIFAKYEHKLATWARDVRKCAAKGRLLESKRREIIDQLGDRFTWDFGVDVSGKKRRR